MNGIKCCLMLVEGPYDRQRLSVLSNLFDNTKLVLIPCGSDVLCSKDYYLSFEKRIKEILTKEKTNEYSDFDEIVQICDMDGCFIDDSFVIEDKTISHIKYEEDCIRAIDLSSLFQARINKRNNINNLLKSESIKLYYNSVNIDHAFDNIKNPSDKDKRNKSIAMYSRYKDNGHELLERLIELCPTKEGYYESWDYIKWGLNSLKRRTNILYFVIEHRCYLKEEYKKIIDKWLKNQC